MLVGYCVDNGTHSKGVLSSDKADGKLTNVGFIHENKFERTLFLQRNCSFYLAGCTSTNNTTAIIAASESLFSTFANKNPNSTAHQRIYTPLSTVCWPRRERV